MNSRDECMHKLFLMMNSWILISTNQIFYDILREMTWYYTDQNEKCYTDWFARYWTYIWMVYLLIHYTWRRSDEKWIKEIIKSLSHNKTQQPWRTHDSRTIVQSFTLHLCLITSTPKKFYIAINTRPSPLSFLNEFQLNPSLCNRKNILSMFFH